MFQKAPFIYTALKVHFRNVLSFWLLPHNLHLRFLSSTFLSLILSHSLSLSFSQTLPPTLVNTVSRSTTVRERKQFNEYFVSKCQLGIQYEFLEIERRKETRTKFTFPGEVSFKCRSDTNSRETMDEFQWAFSSGKFLRDWVRHNEGKDWKTSSEELLS